MSAWIYVEGGGDSKELHARCREGFRTLLEKCGFAGRMPRLVACGGRAAAYDDFKVAHANNPPADYVAMLVDSEDPVADIEATWQHLNRRDGWEKPGGANDDQVLLMTTCMETWIVCDRATLIQHYGVQLQQAALPALIDLETRSRDSVRDALIHATRDCSNGYAKGKRAFEVLTRLNPSALQLNLPSFGRVRRILEARL